MESGQPSFYWYDLETSGTHPASDRIIQFAGMRTDLELNPLGESTSWFVRIGEEVVPSPAACLVTGITPQQTAEQGIGEWEAITEINRLFATPGTCTVGFNNLRFDDEFVRYTLYRNLMDPYAREWRDGNSRWDLIDLVRAAGALRPDGIDWPVIDGRPSFRLEAMTQANGLDHESAHDALSDVQATLSVARLIRHAQPRLWDYFRQTSGKAEIRRMLVPLGANLCVHVSRMYSNTRFCLAPVMSVAQHPEIDNSVIVADLSVDVSNLIERSVDELREMLFTSESEERPGLKAVRFNRCPFVGPIKVVRQQDAT
ncbi:MAG: exodeoxyribonuclease I, partial [Gammaproteobacteria bacterium]|nr:exodeoxyribonuclease I [Gammaproteobacteria bacterium]